jgi:hypothetical protein
MPSQPALPVTTHPPRDTSVADAARRAARDARQISEVHRCRRNEIINMLKRSGPMYATDIQRFIITWTPTKQLRSTLAELQREGKIVHGPQGWSVK